MLSWLSWHFGGMVTKVAVRGREPLGCALGSRRGANCEKRRGESARVGHALGIPFAGARGLCPRWRGVTDPYLRVGSAVEG